MALPAGKLGSPSEEGRMCGPGNYGLRQVKAHLSVTYRDMQHGGMQERARKDP